MRDMHPLPMTISSSAVRGSRLPSLTGMRFIAAGLVFLFHASLANVFADHAVSSDYTQVVAKTGNVGVSFFFVLSGFILTWTARPGDNYGRFWRRRFAKIYPNHLVSWIVVLLVPAAVAIPATSVWTAAANLFLLQSWIPKYNLIFGMNDVTWSLSCEMFFYLVFPWLLPLVARIRAERLWVWAGAVVVVILCVPLLANLFPSEPGVSVNIYSFWFVYALPPVRALEFVLGIIMARIVLTGKWIPIGMVTATVLALAGYVVAIYVPPLYGEAAATIIPIALAIPAAAVADIEGTRSPFRGRVMVRLGEISFAFYIVHRLILTYGHYLLGAGRTWDTAEAFGLLVAGFAIALAVAWLLYTIVEHPAMRLIGGGARRSGPPSEPKPSLNATTTGT
jgi:peptidoglycan/LPS O-acetylase OafA/YrhL